MSEQSSHPKIRYGLPEEDLIDIPVLPQRPSQLAEILNLDEEDESESEAPVDSGDETTATIDESGDSLVVDNTSTAVFEREVLDDIERLDDSGVASIFSVFFRDVGKFSRLTPEEEIELSRRIREQNDKEAFDRFVLANLKLAIAMVNTIVRRLGKSPVLDYMDLIQEAICGLMIAVERFDYKRGNRFSTYAIFWIRQRVRGSLMKFRPGLTVPGFAGESVQTLKKYINLYKQRKYSEIPRGILKRVRDLSHISTQTLSISQSQDDEEAVFDLEKYIPEETSKQEDSIETGFFRVEAWNVIQKAIFQMNRKENDARKNKGKKKSLFVMTDNEVEEKSRQDYDILCRHFGIGVYIDGPQTLREIGAAYGKSQEYARLVIEKTMKVLSGNDELRELVMHWGIIGNCNNRQAFPVYKRNAVKPPDLSVGSMSKEASWEKMSM